MTIIALLSRRSGSLIMAPAIAGVTVWLALLARTPGFNLWPDLVSGMSQASLYTGTLAAGFAAFEANRWTSINVDRLRFGVRSPAVLRLHHAGITICILLAGQLLALAILFVYATTTGTYGSPASAWLASLAGDLVLSAAFGYSLGCLFSAYWFVAPATALAFYGSYVLVAAAPLPYGVRSLFPVNTNTDSVFVQIIDRTLLGQIGFCLGLAAFLITVIGAGWRRGTRRAVALGATATLAIATIGGAVVVSANGQASTGHNPRDFVCKTEEITLCLNRGYSSALGALYSKVAAMNVLVDGTSLSATRLEQNVEGVGDVTSVGARSIYLEQWQSGDDLSFAVNRYVVKYGGDQACQGGTSHLANLYVDAWLSDFDYDNLLEDQPQSDRYASLRRLSPSEGNAWFRAHASKYFLCNLTLEDLP